MKHFTILIIWFLLAIVAQASTPVKVIKLTPELYAFKIDGTTAVASIGKDGILLVDACHKQDGQQLYDSLKKISSKKLKYLVYTHWHSDHTTGANWIEDKQIIISHVNTKPYLETKQIAQGDEYAALPSSCWSNFTITDKTVIFFNNEEIELIPFLPGHTDGDVAVYFKKAKVLYVGDLFVTDFYPSIDYEHGGYASQLLSNLKQIIETMPEDIKIIAAHGIRDYSINDLKAYLGWLEKSTSIIISEYKKGNTLEELIKNDILKEYSKYNGFPQNKEQWIKDVYNSVKNKLVIK